MKMKKYLAIKKINIPKLLNFLFLFLAIMDPTRNIFHLTEVAFILLIFANCKRISFNYLPFIVFCLMSYFLSLSFSITNQNFDKAREISLLTSYSFLFYLFFSKSSKLKTFYYFYRIGLLMSVIVVGIGLFFIFFEDIGLMFINFFRDEKNTIMFSSARRILFVVIISVFYKTSPMIVLLLSYSLYLLFKTHKKKYFIHSSLFMANLLFSGTRANILSALLIVCFIFLFHLYFDKKSIFFFPVLTFLCIAGALILIFLLITTKDASASVKDLHMESEWDLFLSNPIRTFFVGYGPGSMFYTKGWKMFTSQTEVSYMELIRNYGFFGAAGIIFMFLYPFILMFKNKKYEPMLKLSLSLGYLAYLFIAGTNPFLNCATGYLTMSIFYYMANTDITKETGVHHD